MLGCLGDFMILSAILDYELSLVYDIWAWVLKLLGCLYEPERKWRILFVPLNYDASMTQKKLPDIICPIKICKCWMPRWFYDLECNSRLWIVTHIFYMRRVLNLLWCLYDPKGIDGWRILFVPLNFVNVGMPRWFYDFECNSRLWIVTRIWYMSLSFEIIRMPLWAERNCRILFVQLNYDASMTRKELTDIICPIKFFKCWRIIPLSKSKHENQYRSYSKVTTR